MVLGNFHSASHAVFQQSWEVCLCSFYIWLNLTSQSSSNSPRELGFQMGNWDLRVSLSLQSLPESFSSMFLKRCMLSCLSYIWLFVMLWTVAHQAPQSMGFSRQEYRSGLPGPPPGGLSNLGIEPSSLRSPTLTGSLSLGPPGKYLLKSWMRVFKKKTGLEEH